jgi:iron complex transport system substrate-binding protein
VRGPTYTFWLALVAACATNSAACHTADALPSAPWPAVSVALPLERNLTDRCVSSFDQRVDYFPDKAAIAHAVSFRVSYHGSYKVVDFTPQIGSQEVLRYVLVQCGTPVPQNLGDAKVVRVPVRRFASTKLEFSYSIVRLGIVDQLVGVNTMNPVMVPEIIERYRRGAIKEVGTGTHSAIELAMAANPEVVFTFYSAFADSNLHAKLWEAGVTGVPLADHFETTPLGRSEWVKFMALFFNQEQRAQEEFDAVAARYDRLRALASRARTRPGVVAGWPESRTRWALNGGQNFFARLIEDAGGRYVWTSDSMRSLDLADFEQVYDLSGSADYWIGNLLGSRTLGPLVQRDPRLRLFGPVARRGVYNNDKGRLPSGAFPLANEGLGRPDVHLADLIRILHPDLLPDYELTYHYELH